jgi:hypothetical protein
MIVTRDAEPPTEWTHTAISELIEHAHDLSANGNPAGFSVLCGMDEEARSPFPLTEQEYADCRAWIEANADLVRTAWRFEVRPDYL